MSESTQSTTSSESRRAELASLRIHRAEPQQTERSGGSGWGTLFWLLAVAGAGAAGYLSAGRLPGSAAEVEILRVKSPLTGPIGTLTATGYLQAVRRTSIGFKSSGRMLERLVDEGDVVKVGQVLARLDSREQLAAVARQKAALDAARAALLELTAGFRKEEVEKARWALDQAKASRIKADQDLARVKELYGKKAAFKSQLDEAEAAARGARGAVESAKQQLDMMQAGARAEQIEGARAQVKQSEALLELAQSQADETVLKAPFGGTILEKHNEVGGMLMFGGPPGMANNAAEVFTLADLSEMEAEVDIAEASLPQVHAGQLAEIVADAVPDKKYQGAVSKILPRANRQKAIVPVRVRLAKPDEKLRPDLSVKVSFMEQREEPKTAPNVKIPLSAVQDRGGAKAVLVVTGGETHVRLVELGKPSGDEVEVLKGLVPGDSIVARPPAEMGDGMKVREKSSNG